MNITVKTGLFKNGVNVTCQHRSVFMKGLVISETAISFTLDFFKGWISSHSVAEESWLFFLSSLQCQGWIVWVLLVLFARLLHRKCCTFLTGGGSLSLSLPEAIRGVKIFPGISLSKQRRGSYLGDASAALGSRAYIRL